MRRNDKGHRRLIPENDLDRAILLAFVKADLLITELDEESKAWNLFNEIDYTGEFGWDGYLYMIGRRSDGPDENLKGFVKVERDGSWSVEHTHYREDTNVVSISSEIGDYRDQ